MVRPSRRRARRRSAGPPGSPGPRRPGCAGRRRRRAVQLGLALDVALDQVDAVVVVDGHVHDGDVARRRGLSSRSSACVCAERAQAPALPAAARRRAPGLSRPHSHATHPRSVALGNRARRRVHARPSAPHPRLSAPPAPATTSNAPGAQRKRAAARAQHRGTPRDTRRGRAASQALIRAAGTHSHTPNSHRARQRDSHHATSCTTRANEDKGHVGYPSNRPEDGRWTWIARGLSAL
jgi:hypothetical protein